MLAQVQDSHQIGLPSLRHDIQLLPSNPHRGIAPSFTLHDPIRSQYYKIGWVEFELLSRWRNNTAQQLLEDVNSQTTLRVNQGHLDRLLAFLVDNELLLANEPADLQRLADHQERKKTALSKKLFTYTLFYRKSIFNPDPLLTVLDRILQPVYRRSNLFGWLTVLLFAIASFGIGTHAYEFKDNFSSFGSASGLLVFGLVLVSINVIHELGHGIAAKHYGCRVSNMGIALIFMLPVCYCDTTSAWQLSSRRKRLIINAGGILSEILLAIIAAIVWLIAPEGIVKTIAFFVTVTSLFTTLAVNLNPFLKFDGYYLLADFLQIDNFQQKAFSNMRWQFRKWLCDTGEKKPFAFTPRDHRRLCIYATLTWIYRFFLYQIIAWMVYQFWFKALGLLLMSVVVLLMMVKPVVGEIVYYVATVKKSGLSYRTARSLAVFSLIFLLIAVPLPRMVAAPAVFSSANIHSFYAPAASKVIGVFVKNGDHVKQGDVLLKIEDPQLIYKRDTVRQEISLLKHQLGRQSDWSEDVRDAQIGPLDLSSRVAELNDLNKQIDQFTMIAAHAGQVTGIPAWLKPDLWLYKNQVLMHLIPSDSAEIRAYVSAGDIERIDGFEGTYYSDSVKTMIDPSQVFVTSESITELSDASLAIVNGGEIAVSEGAGGRLLPLQNWHQISARVRKHRGAPRELVGYVLFKSNPKSIAASIGNRIYGVILRESGF